MRLGKPHGYPRDSSYYFCFSRVPEPANFTSRIAIWNRKQVTFPDFTPAADILVAQLDEKNWSLVFVFPVNGKNLSLIPINLHDRTAPD